MYDSREVICETSKYALARKKPLVDTAGDRGVKDRFLCQIQFETHIFNAFEVFVNLTPLYCCVAPGKFIIFQKSVRSVHTCTGVCLGEGTHCEVKHNESIVYLMTIANFHMKIMLRRYYINTMLESRFFSCVIKNMCIGYIYCRYRRIPLDGTYKKIKMYKIKTNCKIITLWKRICLFVCTVQQNIFTTNY